MCLINDNNLNALVASNYSGDKRNTVFCSHASSKGYLEILKWLRSEGYHWDEWTCSLAAENGHLDVLKWARENGCSWDDLTYFFAIRNKHFHVSRWAKDNSCPIDDINYIWHTDDENLQHIQLDTNDKISYYLIPGAR